MKLQLKKKAPAPKAKAPVKKLHLTKKAAPAPAPAPVKKGGLRLLSHPTTAPAKDPYGWASTPHSSLMPTGKEPLLGPGGERINGALPPPDPKTVLRADQMQMDMLAVNIRPLGGATKAYCMFRLIGKQKSKSFVELTYYVHDLRQWLEAKFRPDYLLTTDERYLHIMSRPKELPPEQRRAKAVHLIKASAARRDELKKERAAVLSSLKPDPKGRVFHGMVGESKVLCDFGNGQILWSGKPDSDLVKVAKGIKKNYVKQSLVKDENPEAWKVLLAAWKEARTK